MYMGVQKVQTYKENIFKKRIVLRLQEHVKKIILIYVSIKANTGKETLPNNDPNIPMYHKCF